MSLHNHLQTGIRKLSNISSQVLHPSRRAIIHSYKINKIPGMSSPCHNLHSSLSCNNRKSHHNLSSKLNHFSQISLAPDLAVILLKRNNCPSSPNSSLYSTIFSLHSHRYI